MFLRCSVHDSPKQWKSWLPLAEHGYNTSFHNSLGSTPFSTPFKVLYGYEPVVAAVPLLPSTDNKSVQEMLAERQAYTELIKVNLTRAQNKIKLQADKHRTNREFQVGDQVLLKLQPYAQSSLVNRQFPKLSYKYFGPYSVLERIGKAAYKLALPSESQIYPVFHTSQLKSFTPDYTPVYSTLPTLTDFSAATLQPDAILERRLVKKGNTAVPQVLMKWQGVIDAFVGKKYQRRKPVRDRVPA
jgi:hypothetical protein